MKSPGAKVVAIEFSKGICIRSHRCLDRSKSSFSAEFRMLVDFVDNNL